MRKSDRKLTHFSNYLVSIVGIAYWLVKTFATRQTEFGPMSHPIQPYFQYAHILTVPLLVFTIGVIFHTHIYLKIKNDDHANWVSGYSLIITFIIMTMSGYFLQTAIIGANRKICIWVHLVSSAIWVLAYLFHHIKGRKILPPV
jgi:uncharacterized membrane protein